MDYKNYNSMAKYLSMVSKGLDWVSREIEELKSSGRFIPIKILQSSQGAWVKIDGKE